MCYNELNVAQTFLFVAEPLGEAGNRGARSRNAFVCMYIYIYPSQSTIVASINCAIGKMVRPNRQSFLAQRKQVLTEDFAAQTTSKELFSTPSDFLVPVVRRHGNS